MTDLSGAMLAPRYVRYLWVVVKTSLKVLGAWGPWEMIRISSARTLGIEPAASTSLVHGVMRRAMGTMLSGQHWGIAGGLSV